MTRLVPFSCYSIASLLNAPINLCPSGLMLSLFFDCFAFSLFLIPFLFIPLEKWNRGKWKWLWFSYLFPIFFLFVKDTCSAPVDDSTEVFGWEIDLERILPFYRLLPKDSYSCWKASIFTNTRSTISCWSRLLTSGIRARYYDKHFKTIAESMLAQSYNYGFDWMTVFRQKTHSTSPIFQAGIQERWW